MCPLDSESPDERPLFQAEVMALNQYFSHIAVNYFDVFEKVSRRISRLKPMEQSLIRLDEWLLRKKMFVLLATTAFIVARK